MIGHLFLVDFITSPSHTLKMRKNGTIMIYLIQMGRLSLGSTTCLHTCPFCLCLGDFALAPSVLTPCVYTQRQRQETNRQAMEGKNAESKWEGIKQISMISMVSKEAKKQANRQKATGKKANKRWCPQRTNVGDRPNTNWPLVIKLIY